MNSHVRETYESITMSVLIMSVNQVDEEYCVGTMRVEQFIGDEQKRVSNF